MNLFHGEDAYDWVKSVLSHGSSLDGFEWTTVSAWPVLKYGHEKLAKGVLDMVLWATKRKQDRNLTNISKYVGYKAKMKYYHGFAVTWKSREKIIIFFWVLFDLWQHKNIMQEVVIWFQFYMIFQQRYIVTPWT